jgi:hypothetical protein
MPWIFPDFGAMISTVAPRRLQGLLRLEQLRLLKAVARDNRDSLALELVGHGDLPRIQEAGPSEPRLTTECP